MKVKAYLSRFWVTFHTLKLDVCYYHHNPIRPCTKAYCFSTKAESSVQGAEEAVSSPSCAAAQVFKNFGCNETHIQTIFSRKPSLRSAMPTYLESKLRLLSELGIKSAELVKMINCRPRLLSYRLNLEHLDDLQSLFGSRELFIRAIIRNPSLLLYDVEKTVKPVFTLYEEMGLSRSDLISMLLLRPTLIPRTHMTPEKLEYIRKTGIPTGSKMFKYVATIIGVSRVETIQEKVANLEKFGFSEDEVLQLFGRCPLMLTLSVEKVQRHMTFVVGTMKLPAKTVCNYPFLLSYSLEGSLRPRVLLAAKIRDMGLFPKMNGPVIFRALRMSEERFLKVFVKCQEEEVRNELLLYYNASKGIKRLAESSKKASHTCGFPF